jgi:FlaA1/EpsC-like NDP-sugar epimerase
MTQLLAINRRFVIFGVLVTLITISFIGSFLLRFDFAIPEEEYAHLVLGLALALPIKVLILYLAMLHRGWWSSVGLYDLTRIALATVAASIGSSTVISVFMRPGFPRSIYAIDFILTFITISGARVAVRLYRESARRAQAAGKYSNILIYGAGWAGATLVREIWGNPALGYAIVGFIDDNPQKQNDIVAGVKVLGGGADLPAIAEKYKGQIDEVVIAMPSASGRNMREAISHCRAAGLSCKTLPSLGSLLMSNGLTSQIRPISIEDLLCREPVELDQIGIRQALSGRTILVTGAAGSIGSEMCRQIAEFDPGMLIMLDQAESELFKIEAQLRRHFPELNLQLVIGDIRDARAMDTLVRRYLPAFIFHAAAYKHVPLMEAHALQAVNNNVLGTWNVAQAAYRNKVPNFVLISSDKAVNPTNVMGATKRAAELVISSFPTTADGSATNFCAVRFGNVLASNGSVVPTFQAQIAAGGPVTVTHPEVRRYFMTVREAAQLVLQASTLSTGPEVYVLDMGEPVQIVDLARNMIRLSGLVPDEDIEIRFIGLRPGEKLFEELIVEGENIVPTRHEKIKVFQGPRAHRRVIEAWISRVREALQAEDETAVVALLSELVPEYQVSDFWSRAIAEGRQGDGWLPDVSLPISASPVDVGDVRAPGRSGEMA